MPPRKTAKQSIPLPPPPPPRASLFSRPPILIAILGTMFVSALYLWIAQPSSNTPEYTPPVVQNDSPENTSPSNEATESVTDRVSRMILTNTAEKPEVFMVSDVEAFKTEQPQAGDVVEGDKVLSWSDKTVVYSPSRDIIVSVYPTPPKAPPAPEEGSSVEIRNGSGIPGSAARLKKSMTDAGLSVSLVGDAAVRREGTVVIDLSGGKFPTALAKAIEVSGGTAAELPEGEPTSEASFLIVIGQ